MRSRRNRSLPGLLSWSVKFFLAALGSAHAEPAVTARLPLRFQGETLGDVGVAALDNSAITIEAESLYRLTDPVLGDGERLFLRVVALDGWLTQFQGATVAISYDEDQRVLSLTAPYAPRRQRPVSVEQGFENAAQTESPEPSLTDGPSASLVVDDRTLGYLSIKRAGERVSFPTAAFLRVAHDALTDRERELVPILDVGGYLTPFTLEGTGLSVSYDDARQSVVLRRADRTRPALQHTPAAAPAAAAELHVAAPAVRAVPEAPATSQLPTEIAPSPAFTGQPIPVAISASPMAVIPERARTHAFAIDAIDAAPLAAPPARGLDLVRTIPVAPPAPQAPRITPTTPEAAPAGVDPQPSRDARRPAQLDFVFPLMSNGRYIGDVPARVAQDGSVAANAARVVELVRGLYGDTIAEGFNARAADGRIASFTDADGVSLVFDSELQELQLVGSVGLLRVQDVSIAGAGPTNPDVRLQRAAPVAAAITFDLTQSFDHDAVEQRLPLQAVVDGSARLFGDRGFVVESRGLYQEDSAHGWRRGETRLVYDHVPTMISVTLGDLRPGSSGFQTSPTVGGVAVERVFGLQPTRNYRPSGRHGIVLERRNTVTVIVNGVEMRRFDLLPGRYDLRDFPYVEGANNVQVILEDELGQRDTIDLAGYFDNELLAAGVSEFSYAYGATSTDEASGIQYDTGATSYSIFHRIGVTANLTAGLNAQGHDGANLYGAELLWASPIGAIGIDVARSENARFGQGTAALVRYELQPRPVARFSWAFGFSSQWEDDKFSTVDLGGPQDYRTLSDASLRLFHPDWGTLTLGAGYDQARNPSAPNRSEATLSYSRALVGNLYGTFQARASEIGGERTTSIGATLSLRFGGGNTVTARHDTGTELSELDWFRAGSYGVGGISTNARVGHNNRSGETFANGAVSYYGNRFEATLSNDTRSLGAAGEAITSRSTARVGTTVAYAGSRVALGRPTRGAFAIVGAHETLDGHQVRLGGADDRPRAQTGWFGPALLPNLGHYSLEGVPVEVENLPAGYDLGAAQIDFRAYRGAGYNVEVGSDASLTLFARLVAPSGEPVTLVASELLALDRQSEPIQAYANRTGRFVASGVSPGRYRLVVFTDPRLEAIVVVARSSEPLVQLGDIRLQEAAP